MTNLNRYFPKGYLKITPKGYDGVEIGISDDTTANGTRYSAIAYSGKRSKKDFFESYQTIAKRDERITRYLEHLDSVKAWRTERAGQRRLETNPLKVGDILYTSWGYDQTNVEFFQVLEVKGGFCQIKQLRSATVEGSQGMDCSKVTAVKNSFISEDVFRQKILTSDGGKSIYLKINKSASAWLWDGQPKYSSWYA